MPEPAKLAQLVKPSVDANAVEHLEQLLEDARRGDFQGFIIFKFGELPRTVSTTIGGKLNEASAVLAIERWKVNHLLDR